MSRQAEERGQAEHRRELLEDLRGRVIELGAGNGINFRHYPDTVDELVAVEPEPYLRERAERAAADAPIDVRVVSAVAEDLPGEDGSYDAGVACLVLCSVPDQAAALAELFRVIKPGGELRFYEHVRADRQPLRAILEIADRTRIWPAIGGGCHPTRDTVAAIRAAGFEIETCERFPFSPAATVPTLPYVLGVARAAH